MRRFYVKDAENAQQTGGSEAAHMLRVLRMNTGDEVVLFDGSGYDYPAIITDVGKDHILYEIKDKVLSKSEPRVKVTLCQAVIKHDHFDYAVQKCTEIGIYAVKPFYSERCVKKPKSAEKFIERSNRIALEAAKQSGRSLVPLVSEIMEFAQLVDFARDKFTIFAYEGEKNTSLKNLLLNNSPDEIVLVVGPEGGFTTEEARMLILAGAHSVSLGKLILRSETAGLAATAMIMYEYGDKA